MKDKPYTLYDLGVDENFLMENVAEVSNGMDLNGSSLTAAPKLKKVGIQINFGDNKINDLRNLEEINGKKVIWKK